MNSLLSGWCTSGDHRTCSGFAPPGNIHCACDCHQTRASDNIDDPVNHPKHYASDPSGIECIEVVRHRNFNIGNAIKYLWRAGLKSDGNDDPKAKQIEDIRKAIWYLHDEIGRLENEGQRDIEEVRRTNLEAFRTEVYGPDGGKGGK